MIKAKLQNKGLYMYPKVILMNDIDGFLVVTLTPRVTGLSHTLVFESEASERLRDYQPYFYVCKEKRLIPISISDRPFVVGAKINEGEFSDVTAWSRQYWRILEMHWYGRIDDPELCLAITRIHQIDMGKGMDEMRLDSDERIFLKRMIALLENK